MTSALRFSRGRNTATFCCAPLTRLRGLVANGGELRPIISVVRLLQCIHVIADTILSKESLTAAIKSESFRSRSPLTNSGFGPTKRFK